MLKVVVLKASNARHVATCGHVSFACVVTSPFFQLRNEEYSVNDNSGGLMQYVIRIYHILS